MSDCTQSLLDQVCVGIVYCCFPSYGILLVLFGKCICGVPFTWDMANLLVVPLHDVDPLPYPCIDAGLVWKMTEWSMVFLNHYKVEFLKIVFPLGLCPHYIE